MFLSFLPYVVVFSLICTLWCIWCMIRRYPLLSQWLRWLWIGGIVSISISTIWYINFYLNTYTLLFQHSSSFDGTISTSWTITVLYANIYKNNTQYEALEEMIRTYDPDLLLFVEFSDHHYHHLQPFLHQHYPYNNTVRRSPFVVGSMVFSKYPLTNKAHLFPQWTRRYGYFSLDIGDVPIVFYLIHTSSPNTYAHFRMRNTQLTSLVQDIYHHQHSSDTPILLVWDWNTTPFSWYYRHILVPSFSGMFHNLSLDIWPLFTWKLFYFPFLQAHIDHVWISSHIKISSFIPIAIPCSDHDWFVFSFCTH